MLKRIAKIAGALVVAYVVGCAVFYLAGFRFYVTPGNDMQPTIRKNEKFFGRHSEGYRKKVRRYDLVIFTLPDSPGVFRTKRVIGLPGEKLTIDDLGVFIDGSRLSLPPTMSTNGFRAKKANITIPSGTIFVLGDFTENSMDSRYHGPIPLKDVVGQVVFKE